MKVRVLLQRALLRAIEDSALARNPLHFRFLAPNILARLAPDDSGFPTPRNRPLCPFQRRCADIGYARTLDNREYGFRSRYFKDWILSEAANHAQDYNPPLPRLR